MADDAGSHLLSAAQAAARLGVKRETLYAYVSRGQLRRVQRPGLRGSWFDRSALDAVAGRRRVGLSEDVRTRITLIGPEAGVDRLRYRGVDAVRLATTATLPEVARLIWQQPVELRPDPALLAAMAPAVSALPEQASLADRLTVAIRAAASQLGDRYDTDPVRVATHGGLLMSCCALTPGLDADLDPVAATAAATAITDLRWVEQAMILLADHDLAGSTIAARVAASTGADLAASLCAALAAFDSPLHGAAGRAVMALLQAAGPDPSRLTADLRAAGLPGFGHLVHRESDPRAEFLLAELNRRHDHPLLERSETVIEDVAATSGQFPNIDYALAVGTIVLGGAADAPERIFALARMIGWTAHVMEEQTEPRLRFRLRGVYVGERAPLDPPPASA